MLSFQIVPRGKSQVIQIYCDDAGLAVLIGALERVRETGHLHLRAPGTGGQDLSKTTPFGEEAVDEVIITTGGD